MDPVSLLQLYQAVQACYKTGRFAYRLADRHVAAYADREGISKRDAWAHVRAEAQRQGDVRITQAADLVLAGSLGPVLIPGGLVLVPAAHAWRMYKGRQRSTNADKPTE